jgi:hypothetical protein
LARETKVLGENLPQCRFVHHKPYMLCPDANPSRRGGKSATNRLSYGTAFVAYLLKARTVEAEKQPLLDNGPYTRSRGTRHVTQQ